MADEQRVKMWSSVPNGSKLIVTVDGTTDTNFVVATIDGLAEPPKKGQEIKAIIDTAEGAPFELPLLSPKRYSVDIVLVFMTDATSTVRARIVNPQGKQFKEALETKITRSKGAIESVALSVGTKKVS